VADSKNSKKRCAVYTRKSTEEGLEQAFNSLDAQREACAAYVLSQRHEGWQLLPETYDDGGYSGGSMARPGLAQLMADVAAGKVDTIVVYKVDRLTRSLADFAKIVEVLDAKGASFVSVTQAFNTTTSMGRLTLNVLLSFAQFEREVTGERIRDKVAASKAKGMWMGGPVPLGYKLGDRKLVIDEAEAATVRHIFTSYAKLRSLADLVDELAEAGIRTRQRVYKDGRTVGGVMFTKGPLAWLLANRVYVGEVGHKGQIYPGEHEAIIDRTLWDAVQTTAADNRVVRRLGSRGKAPSLLTGLIVDRNGLPMSPTYAVRDARRYRYYATRLPTGIGSAKGEMIRLPAHNIEVLVVEQLAAWLEADPTATDTSDVAELIAFCQQRTELALALREGNQIAQRALLLELGVTVVIAESYVDIHMDGTNDIVPATKITAAATLGDRGSDLRMAIAGDGGQVDAAPDPVLLKLIVLAFAAREAAISGKPEPLVDHYSRQHLTRLARLSYLAPDLVSAIIDGRQPPELNGRRLLRIADLPLDWNAQRRMLGFT
jgi:site-specific DNA recombinase